MRQRVRTLAIEAGLSLVDQTKIVTAASELARNTLDYGGGGSAELEVVNGVHRGVRLTFVDQGPGIRDIEAALRDGFTTGDGLGLGLGGAKRLSQRVQDRFDASARARASRSRDGNEHVRGRRCRSPAR